VQCRESYIAIAIKTSLQKEKQLQEKAPTKVTKSKARGAI
jgi:hypothetical protein